MQTKTSQVRTALAACILWYAAREEDIRLLTERTETLWFQIDDLVCALQEAEGQRDTATVEHSLQDLLRCALLLQAEMSSDYARSQRSK